METFEKIIEQYTQSEVCMGELLANISADGMSIEDAFELYIKAMNYARENIKDSVQAAWFHCSHKATVKELIEHFKSV